MACDTQIALFWVVLAGAIGFGYAAFMWGYAARTRDEMKQKESR